MDIDEIKQSRITDFCDRNNIGLFIIFGSHAKARVRPHSDIDIAIALEEQKSDVDKLHLIFELEGIFQEQVDLVILKPTTDPLLRFEVFSTGKPLFMSNSQLFEESKLQAWKAYLDTEKIRELRREYVKNHIRKLRDDFGSVHSEKRTAY